MDLHYRGRPYDYPPEGFRIDPLDTSVDETQYVIHAGGPITYAWTGRDAVFDARLVDVIPNNRYMLTWTQKVAVAHDGAVVREWPLVNEPRAPRWSELGKQDGSDDAQKAYEAERARIRRICGYIVINDVGKGSPLEDRYDHEAVLAALRAASSHGRAALALFARRHWLVVIGRHSQRSCRVGGVATPDSRRANMLYGHADSHRRRRSARHDARLARH